MSSLHIKACRTEELQSSRLQYVLLCWTYPAESFEHCQNGFQAQCGTWILWEFRPSSYTGAVLCVTSWPAGVLILGNTGLAQNKGFDKNVAKIKTSVIMMPSTSRSVIQLWWKKWIPNGSTEKSTVMWFGFSMRTILLPHFHFGCCWTIFTLSKVLFSFLCSNSEEAKQMWEGAQNSWPELAKEIFCTTEYHAQYINWGWYLEGYQFQFGNKFGVSQQALKNCIIHHLFFFSF